MEDKYFKLYDELVEIANEIRPYYDIDKVKSYSVYIWTKEVDDNGYDCRDNVFDIQADKIVFYDKEHRIIEDALPIIIKIQSKLKEIEEELK